MNYKKPSFKKRKNFVKIKDKDLKDLKIIEKEESDEQTIHRVNYINSERKKIGFLCFRFRNRY